MSKFADHSEGIAESLRVGLPIEVAADQAGVSASTVRGWLRRGKREPDSEFGAFARAAKPAAEGEDGAMSVEEVEHHLTAVIRRSQSVAAMKLWLELHPENREGVPNDPFSEFDAR
jgi:transposase